jgi:hypothetical protein
VSLRGIATAASTFVVAIALALIVPTAQLRTVADVATCCCPDPDKCKCHDHDADGPTQSSMRACHKQAPEIVKTQLPRSSRRSWSRSTRMRGRPWPRS